MSLHEHDRQLPDPDKVSADHDEAAERRRCAMRHDAIRVGLPYSVEDGAERTPSWVHDRVARDRRRGAHR